MLAYVFWHWPLPEIDSDDYERMQRDFHLALAATEPAGFSSSWTFRIDGAPWVPAGARGYEDWYLLEDFAALGPLNDNAITGACREPHTRIASAADAGAGGLYRLRSGQPDIAGAQATWLVKGKQTSYEELYRRFEPLGDRPGVSLWRRQMVLGPAPEFCLLSPGQIDQPAGFETLVIRREPVAP